MNPAAQRRPIYLDNNATTEPLPEVIAAILDMYRLGPLNPSSVHADGDVARRRLETAREQVASLIGASPAQLVFTSGATESNHLILRNLLVGSLKEFRLITSPVEHSSVVEAARDLEFHGTDVRWIPVDGEGRVALDAVRKLIRSESTLVSVQWANNETGVLQPIETLAEICQERGALLHTDAVQAVGKVPIDLSTTSIDFLSLSGHKLHGPLGVGALFVRDPSGLHPILRAGNQEKGLRPGTENLPAIVGLGTAASIRAARLRRLTVDLACFRDDFEKHLASAGIVEVIHGARVPRLPNTSNVRFRDVDGEALLLRLDQMGVRCSQSSACTNRRPEPSYVLRAMGLTEAEAYRSIRFSFSELNSRDDVQKAVSRIVELHSELTRFHIPVPQA